jgi:hypothetical protein
MSALALISLITRSNVSVVAIAVTTGVNVAIEKFEIGGEKYKSNSLRIRMSKRRELPNGCSQ